MSLTGKVALVTGASRGIGKAIAEALQAAGATVIGTATTEAGAEKISAYLGAGQGFCLNVTNPESINTVITAIQEKFGAPTILVNNAGITRDNIALRMKDEEWDEVIETNLSSIYRVTKACLKGMTKARWGRVINISSVVGSMGNAGQSNYAAAKAGLEGYTRSMARELGVRNITFNTVAPGFIDTDMTRELAEEHKNMMLAQIPLSRLGEPKEIAAVVAFIAGDGAAYITGATIPVNGGMYM